MGINGLTVGAAYNNSRFFNGDIVEIIIYDTNLTDTQRQQVEQYLMDKYAPPISLGEDITVDYGFCPITLQVNEGYSDIEWSTGDSTEQITVNQSGEYWVTATDFFGRITSDTINVNFLNLYYQQISFLLWLTRNSRSKRNRRLFCCLVNQRYS